MFAPLLSQWHSTKGRHHAWDSVIYKDYQRNMMSEGKLKLCVRPTGRQSCTAAQTEWMYLLFMWKSMGPDRWWLVSSLFTPRLHDKCPCCPSWADGAQVSRNHPFPARSKHMTDVSAFTIFISFFCSNFCFSHEHAHKGFLHTVQWVTHKIEEETDSIYGPLPPKKESDKYVDEYFMPAMPEVSELWGKVNLARLF